MCILTLESFNSIDPTPCHASAHPLESGSTIAFSVQDTESETPNNIPVSEITTRHLRRLRQSASDFSGKAVTSAVIAVPTDASEAQKEALAKAAQNAHVNVLQFIAEPIAALMAYDVQGDHGDRIVVVADLGGTRSDVAVIASRGGLYSILATAHDYELGGVKLDQVLIDHFAKEFIKKHKTDPRENERSLAKLKLEAEAVKKALSLSASATLSIESLTDGLDFRSTINRTRYELLAGKVFQSFIRLVEEAVRKADLDLLDIDQVGDFPVGPCSGSQVIDHTIRRYITHAQDRTEYAIILYRSDYRACSFNVSNCHKSGLSVSDWGCYPSFTHPGI